MGIEHIYEIVFFTLLSIPLGFLVNRFIAPTIVNTLKTRKAKVNALLAKIKSAEQELNSTRSILEENRYTQPLELQEFEDQITEDAERKNMLLFSQFADELRRKTVNVLNRSKDDTIMKSFDVFRRSVASANYEHNFQNILKVLTRYAENSKRRD